MAAQGGSRIPKRGDAKISCNKHMRGWRGGGRTDPKIHHRVNDGMISFFDIPSPNSCWE